MIAWARGFLSPPSMYCRGMTTAPAKPAAPRALVDCDLPGVRLTNDALRVRVTDNSPRYNHVVDCVMSGMNGIALLFDKKHHKNIFTSSGLAYCAGSTRPASGPGVAPGLAPMAISRTDDGRAVLTQRGADTNGLDMRIEYALGARHIDQTITVSSERSIEFFDTFWTSNLNGTQNTSLFLQGVLQGGREPQWLEVCTPGMGNAGRVYYRPFDPRGKGWNDHLVDNPLLRQKAAADAESIAATLAAASSPTNRTSAPSRASITGSSMTTSIS